MADANAIIKRLVESGEVCIGGNSVRKMLLKASKTPPKLVILSSNCPEKQMRDIKHYATLSQTPVYVFEGNGLELGELCRKPFVISVIGVKSAGSSVNLKELLKEATITGGIEE